MASSNAVPASQGGRSVILEGIDMTLPTGTNGPTKRLVQRILRRNVTAAGVANLTSRGADVNVAVTLIYRDDAVAVRLSALALAIDTSSYFSPLACRSEGACVILPLWPTRQHQEDIITALLAGEAYIDGHYGHNLMPVQMAKQSLNLTALNALLTNNAEVSNLPTPILFTVDGLLPQSEAEEEALTAITHRLLLHDPSLATETDVFGFTPLHDMASLRLSEGFINEYMDTLVNFGADVTAENGQEKTPLMSAAGSGAYLPLLYLCQRLTAADIDHQTHFTHRTALSFAARGLQWGIESGDPPEKLNDDHKKCICTLLRYGASIGLLPTDTPDRLQQSLVLEQYEAVLNELPSHVMAAINAALEPQRDTAARIGCLLPMAPHHDGAYPHPSPSSLSFGPQEATAIAWKIGAFSHDPTAARAAIDEYLVADSQLKRRVSAAVDHFVEQAATKTAGNAEVVGAMADVEGETVRVPLQCFAINGQRAHRRLGVREVVHRARLDEAAAYSLTGVVKGFNTHLGNDDCSFQWGQLGHVHQSGRFVQLAIS
ncbi:unnamed protein product [Vitrella brassicaformis CCMP3155]|uniref:Uncharacterized protein n=1 Tax=Vitrella brassicaformis (strain CCMP3155) TaxID=1169540 RepID=A0A0G4GYF8_VITBC|nr:unnamed protein product [Vitrella brassicaformis CCMP3155]|eukprot:CEM36172.1 unnamed protein product [Vitrella brassicaformis CCMP3155]